MLNVILNMMVLNVICINNDVEYNSNGIECYMY